MERVDLKDLIAELNKTCHRALEQAAALCHARRQSSIEIEHVLYALLEIPGTDLRIVLKQYGIDSAEISSSLLAALKNLEGGSRGTPSLSPTVIGVLERARVVSHETLQSPTIRSAGILLTLLEDEFQGGARNIPSILLDRIPARDLSDKIGGLIRGSEESVQGPVASSVARAAIASALRNSLDTAPVRSLPESETERASRHVDFEPNRVESTQKPSGADRTTSRADERTSGVEAPGTQDALEKYTVDLTGEAHSSRLDPVVGRDSEIRQIIDILMRRRQNNPMLAGEAGVGKTAIVEGLAQHIAEGNVPPALKNTSLRALDVGLLQAGAGVRGEFEQRLKEVIAAVNSSAVPVILFIDEAHTLIGAGGKSGQNDAANLLKPALARGELRTIAATTWSEYKRYIEKDRALARRFQVVRIDEPSEDAAQEMLRAVALRLEEHHRVRILDEAVEQAVRLSHRYLTERFLPDNAVSVLDTACARVAVAQHSTPEVIENLDRETRRTNTELQFVAREQALGRDHYDRIVSLKEKLRNARRSRALLEEQWAEEKSVVQDIVELQKKLEVAGALVAHPIGEEVDWDRRTLEQKYHRLQEIQETTSMIPVCVDARTVAAVISDWTGIPAGKMMSDDTAIVMTLERRLRARIVGQDDALKTIAHSIQTSWADLVAPERPVGAFLLSGPTGTGKTETALALADILYRGSLIQVNMSEYQEAHTVSKLKGAPAGYVGYGLGGVLTEAIRRNPYSVVLLDEIDKAHSDVLELFYQVLDKGLIEDAEGVEVSFRNATVILTTNRGGESDFDDEFGHDIEKPYTTAVRDALSAHFPESFLGRLVVVPYFPLRAVHLREIVLQKLHNMSARVEANHGVTIQYSDELPSRLAADLVESNRGARNIDVILSRTILPGLAAEMLKRKTEQAPSTRLFVHMGSTGPATFDAR